MNKKWKTYVLQSNLGSAENIKGIPHVPSKESTFVILAGEILALCWMQEHRFFLSAIVLADSTNALYAMQHSLDGSWSWPVLVNGLHMALARWLIGPPQLRAASTDAITANNISTKYVILAIAACVELYLYKDFWYIHKNVWNE